LDFAMARNQIRVPSHIIIAMNDQPESTKYIRGTYTRPIAIVVHPNEKSLRQEGN
jgi:hypothetical protein